MLTFKNMRSTREKVGCYLKKEVKLMTTLIWPRSGTLQTPENLSGQCPRVCVKLKSGNTLESWRSLKK